MSIHPLRAAYLLPLLLLAACPSGGTVNPPRDLALRDLKAPVDGAAGDQSAPPDLIVVRDQSVPPDLTTPDLRPPPDLRSPPDLRPPPDLMLSSNTIDTHNFMGMTEYPLDLDICTCCGGTTTQQEADAFCQLAGFTVATSWTKAMIAGTNCYCWGGCSNFKWMSNCCSGFTTRPFLTSITCQ